MIVRKCCEEIEIEGEKLDMKINVEKEEEI